MARRPALADPVELWGEPYCRPGSRNVWWSFRRADGHPVLLLMHRPGKKKRSVVMLESGDWDAWLHGTVAQADALVKLPPLGALRSGAKKPEEESLLPAEQQRAPKAEE
ncbi:hypothetical protein [Delftia acidovorans]